MFGKTFRKINKGGIINSVNNKDCLVEIEFETNGKSYKISRGIKPNIFKIYCEGTLINQTAVGDYQDFLEKTILKMSHKAFCSIVILGSARFVPFMQLSAADRRSVVEDLLDLQVFSVMSSVMKNRLSTNKTAIQTNDITLTSKKESKLFIEKTIQSLKANNQEKIEELKAEQILVSGDISLCEDEIQITQDQLDSLLENGIDISKLRKKHSQLTEYRVRIETNRVKIDEESHFLQNHDTCPTCKQSIERTFRIETIFQNNNKIREIDDGLETLDQKINDAIVEIEKVEKTLDTINKLRVSVSSLKTNHRNLITKLDDLNETIHTLSTTDKTTNNSLQELQDITTEISELEKTKETLLEERKYIDIAVLLLKDGGIKSKIIKQYTPILNQQINKYLNRMGFGISFELDENFDETIKSRYRDEFAYANFSEGEKLRIDLSILLAFRDIARMKNSVNTNLLIFDEILDSALDNDGIEEFLKIIFGLTENTNTFIISHRDGINEKFQETYRFTKQRNFTILKKEE